MPVRSLFWAHSSMRLHRAHEPRAADSLEYFSQGCGRVLLPCLPPRLRGCGPARIGRVDALFLLDTERRNHETAGLLSRAADVFASHRDRAGGRPGDLGRPGAGAAFSPRARAPPRLWPSVARPRWRRGTRTAPPRHKPSAGRWRGWRRSRHFRSGSAKRPRCSGILPRSSGERPELHGAGLPAGAAPLTRRPHYRQARDRRGHRTTRGAR